MSMTDPATSESGTGESTTGSGGLSVPLGVHVDALAAKDVQLVAKDVKRIDDLRASDHKLAEERVKRLEERAMAQDKAVSAALASAEKAIEKSEANAEKWRENANEWRGAMSDRDRELPSRRELEAVVERFNTMIEPLATFVTAQMERAEVTTENKDTATNWKIALTGFGVTVVLALVVLASNGKIG